MKLAEFSVKNSLFVNLLSVFVLVMGVVAMFTLIKEVFPNVTFDLVQISNPWPGATSEDVEKLVTTPIEKELKKVNDIDEIRSVSTDNLSIIYVKMNPDAKNKDRIVNEVQRAVDRVKDLPLDVDDPVVVEISAKEIPIIEVAISGDVNELTLQGYAETLEDMFLDLKGVAGVTRRGFRDREIWVEVDPAKLDEMYVSMEEVMEALNRRNVNIPAGVMRGDEKEFNIRTVGEFMTAREVEDVVIRANDAGNWLKIKDVAFVRDSFEDESEISRSSGTRAINLVILKKEKADALKLVAEVRGIIKSYEASIKDDITINTLDDLSYYIKRRLNVLRNNAWVGFALVIMSLLVFLTRRVAIFTALGIPIAFSVTLAAMLFMGYSINMMTMFALIIVLGMLVDDGIIVAENSYRYMEEGLPPKEAAVKGTQEVMAAVTTTILTTIAAFLPLMFMTGIIGKFMRPLPVIVIIALLASLVEAFVVLPSHLADFARPYRKKMGDKVYSKKELPWFQGMLRFYTRIVTAAIRHRYRVAAGFVVVFVIFICLARCFVKTVLFPQRGVEEFYLRAEAIVGTSLEKTSDLTRQLEGLIENIPKNELDSYVTTVGSIFEGRAIDPYTRRGSHLVQLNVYLTPEAQRDRNASQIIDGLRHRLKDVKGFEKVYFEQIKHGPPTGAAVDVRVKGEDYKVLNEIADDIIAYLGTLKGVTDIDKDYKYGKDEIRVIVDEKAAAAAHLTIGAIASTVRSAFEGGLSTSIKRSKAEEEIDVLVRFPRDKRSDIGAFERIDVPNKFGNRIPLSEVASIEMTRGLESINHLDGKRRVRITAQVDEKQMTSHEANRLLQKRYQDIPNKYLGYTMIYGGEEKETMESLGNLRKAFLVAFLLIFVILATNFNSLVQPFIIMLAIPFGIIGVIIALIIHREPFSFMAFLGVVGMIGVVVNDSIVLVDFINILRREGKTEMESIVQAGQLRLRPVILTTVTTVLGLAPVAYGIGGKDPFVTPAALSISWGLLFGTSLTLIMVPCIYAIIDDVAVRTASMRQRLSSIKN